MKKCILLIFSLLVVSSIYASEFRAPPEVNVYMPMDDVKVGESGIIELTIHNPIANDVDLNGELSLRTPSGVIVEGGDIVDCGGGKYYLKFSAKPGDGNTITLYLKFPSEGRYTIDGKISYWADDDKNNYKDIKLHKIIAVTKNKDGGGSWNYIVVIIMMGLIATAAVIYKKRKEKDENIAKIEDTLKNIEEKIKEVSNEIERQKLKKEKARILCDLVVSYVKNNNYSNAITTLKDLKDLLNLTGNANYNDKIDKLILSITSAMRDNIKLNKEDLEIINEIIKDIKRKYQ